MADRIQRDFEAQNLSLDRRRTEEGGYTAQTTRLAWNYWLRATVAAQERFAEIWENDAAQAAIDYANGYLVNWTAGADKIRKGEAP